MGNTEESARIPLAAFKLIVSIVQAAYQMSLEGVSRVTALEVAEKVDKDFDISVTPSYVGYVFANLNLRTVTTHGKKRFVLDPDELKGIKERVTAVCEQRMREIDSTLESYKGFVAEVKSLEDRCKEMIKLVDHRKELITYIEANKHYADEVADLEEEASQLKEEAAKAQVLQAECKRLSRHIKAQPALEERREKLTAAINDYNSKVRQYQAQESDVSSKEQVLAKAIFGLQKRKGLAEIAELEEAIKEAKRELNDLSRQLGEKRSLFDRLFMKRKDGGNR